MASTFETERGNLLEGPRDNHPSSSDFDEKGKKVIQKYNRHWAMVMHPKNAVAGSDLMQLARQSVSEVIPGDEDAKVGEYRRGDTAPHAGQNAAGHHAGARQPRRVAGCSCAKPIERDLVFEKRGRRQRKRSDATTGRPAFWESTSLLLFTCLGKFLGKRVLFLVGGAVI